MKKKKQLRRRIAALETENADLRRRMAELEKQCRHCTHYVYKPDTMSPKQVIWPPKRDSLNISIPQDNALWYSAMNSPPPIICGAWQFL